MNSTRVGTAPGAPGRSRVENLVAWEEPRGGDSQLSDHWLLPRRELSGMDHRTGEVSTAPGRSWVENLWLLRPVQDHGQSKIIWKTLGFSKILSFLTIGFREEKFHKYGSLESMNSTQVGSAPGRSRVEKLVAWEEPKGGGNKHALLKVGGYIYILAWTRQYTLTVAKWIRSTKWSSSTVGTDRKVPSTASIWSGMLTWAVCLTCPAVSE